LNEFRFHGGVDISKLKRDPIIDDNPFDKVTPAAELLYYTTWAEPNAVNGSTS